LTFADLSFGDLSFGDLGFALAMKSSLDCPLILLARRRVGKGAQADAYAHAQP